MKLIKINQEHYIIVDDSEIDYDSEPYLLIKDDYETYIHKHKGDNKPTTEHYKITHSTIPKGMMLMEGIERLSLQEVKELIGEVDVEKKAFEYTFASQSHRRGFIDGYNQAIEDNKEKKYTEAQMRECWRASVRFDRPYHEGYAPNFEEFIQSLQPKTEWDVEIEMEDSFTKNDEVYEDENNAKGNYYTHSKKPKLDSDGCIILKLKLK